MATITRTSDRDRENLRRSAINDQGPNAEDQSGGGYPFDRLMQQYVQDDGDPTNVSFPMLRRMRHDHMLALALHFIIMPIVGAQWYFDCDNARVATFADRIVRPIYGRLVLTIMRMLWAGFSPAVKRFEPIKPNWVYFENGQVKQVWDSPSVDAMVYRNIVGLKPEHCRPKWKSGKFNGIEFDGRYAEGWFFVDGMKQKKIDLLHSVWATHDLEMEDNRIYGYPRIARAAPAYHMYWYIWTLLGRAFENNADPGPVIRYPRDDAPLFGDDGSRVKNVQTALKLGRRKRSGATLGLPSEPYTDFTDRPSSLPKWGIEYPKAETEFEPIMEWLGMLDAIKMRAMLAPEQSVIEGKGSTSSRNVIENASEQRDESQGVLFNQIAELITNVMVKPSLAMNLPWFEGTIEMKTLGLGQSDEDAVRQFFQLIGQENWQEFGINAQRIAESRGFPMLSPAEHQRQLQEAAARAASAAEQSAPPEVAPTQGRRALVTQTGFSDEPIYHQLESIHLAEDGNFVQRLPRTVHFSDEAVVALSRQLRGISQTYLKNLYNDFARHIASQRSLSLDTDLGESADELADEDKARRLAARLVKGWKPRAERAINFGVAARNALGRIYDRTTRLHLRSLGSDKSVTSADKLAAKWLDERGADLVTGVTDTVREELRDFLAREVREGVTPKQLAAKLKAEYSDWPAFKADRIARTETTEAYNFATLTAGQSAGIKTVQILDGSDDQPCRARNGKIMSIVEALHERLAHPNCTLGFRLIPKANLSVRREPLVGLFARYDIDTETILLDPEIDPEEETRYLLAVGERLAA